MSQDLPESQTVFFPVWLIALLMFIVIIAVLAFALWPETGGGWVGGLRDFIKAVRI